MLISKERPSPVDIIVWHLRISTILFDDQDSQALNLTILLLIFENYDYIVS